MCDQQRPHIDESGNRAVAGLASDTVRVRDSKNPKKGVLSFSAAEWDVFIGGVRNGEFDRTPLD